MPRKVRGVGGSWGSGALTLRSVGQGQCRVALDGGTGGCGRHHDRDGTFRVPDSVFERSLPSLTWCLCVVLLGAVPQTSCPICCSCRVYIYVYLRADCEQARGDFTRQSGGVAVVV